MNEIKVLYIWIANYKSISDKEFNLDSEYKINYNRNTKELSLKKNSSYIENFFSLNKNSKSNISSLSSIVGKNGSGKSTIIRFLIDFIILKRYIECIIVYSIKDSNGEKIVFHSTVENIKYNEMESITTSNLKNSIETLKIIYIDQLYSNQYFEEYEYNLYNRLSNKSSNFLVKEDSNKKDTFDLCIQNHYTKEILRQSSFISFLNKIEKNDFLDKIPNYFIIENKNLNILVVDHLKSLISNIESRLKQEKQIKQRSAEEIRNIAEDNDSPINVFNGLKLLIKEIQDKNKELLDNYNNLNINDNIKKVIFNIKVAINIFHLKILSFSFPPITIDIYPNKEEKIEEINLLLSICKYFKDEKIDSFNIRDFILKFQKNDNFFFSKYTSQLSFIEEINTNSYFDNISPDNNILCFFDINKFSKFLNKGEYILNNTLFNYHWGIYDQSDDKKTILRLSSGESNFLSIFSRFYSAFDDDKIGEGDNCLVLIDECELTLHPEWQRKFIFNIVKFIEYLPKKYNFQVLVTSHSPFIISDIPYENIITMSDTNNDNIFDNRTFSSNISKLFKNNFFLNNTVGEFSLAKMKDLVKKIDTTERKDVDYDYLKKFINIIGEPFIREQLNDMLERKIKLNDTNIFE